tara:strand:- start:160878 stop:162179 length:1302 start_codon:yes stop_codon:yes gene_type:complete
MALDIQAVKGMKDILPAQIQYWQYLEQTLVGLLSSYGYDEIRSPLLEPTDLFKRAIGQVTDIVGKEMYTFEDKENDKKKAESLTLRPEGTAQCVRAGIEHGLLYNQVQKLWYMGPMFRRENPQKGRLRQFHQLGVEAFGLTGPDIDIEILLMTYRLWQKLGLEKDIKLELNSLGTYEERLEYRKELVKYFKANESELDADSIDRLENNPLRILDSKNPALKTLIENAPTILEHLGLESKQHFDGILAALELYNIPYTINTRLVRGLDYYTHTVFEWTSNLLGAQSTVCAGGRYDDLVKLIGGKSTPSTGFALGLERLLLILEEKKSLPELTSVDAYIVHDDIAALGVAEILRDKLPNLKLICHCGGGKFKAQFKKADMSGARWAIVIGEDERAQNKYTVKSLREELPQQTFALEALVEFLDKNMNQNITQKKD